MHDIKISLQVVADAQLRYHRPCPIPYAMHSWVDAELDRLEKGVIEPVAHSMWLHLLYLWLSMTVLFAFVVTLRSH